jgi:uncharacterized protein
MIRPWAALTLAMVLTGCSSPRERLYMLEGTATADLDAAGMRRGTVVLGPISIPPEFDRPQVALLEGGRLAMSEQDRWALPLKQAIPRALADELTQRTHYRFVPPGSAAFESPAARLAVDVMRFEASRTGAVVAAHWVWRPATAHGSPAIEGEASAHAELQGTGYAAVVDSLRRATADLADRIAAQLPPPPPESSD